jgi:hypothetical protein
LPPDFFCARDALGAGILRLRRLSFGIVVGETDPPLTNTTQLCEDNGFVFVLDSYSHRL